LKVSKGKESIFAALSEKAIECAGLTRGVLDLVYSDDGNPEEFNDGGPGILGG
jgi:hypothetical protein